MAESIKPVDGASLIDGQWSCHHCDKVLPKRPSMVSHVKIKHPDTKTAPVVTHWEDISEPSADGKSRICNDCHKSFSANSIVTHWTSMHTDTTHECPNCLYASGDKRTVTRHERSAHSVDAEHDPERDECTDCSSAWITSRRMIIHKNDLCLAPGKVLLEGVHQDDVTHRLTRVVGPGSANQSRAAVRSRKAARAVPPGDVQTRTKKGRVVLCDCCDLPVLASNKSAHRQRRHQVPTDSTRPHEHCDLCNQAWWVPGGRAKDTLEVHKAEYYPKNNGWIRQPSGWWVRPASVGGIAEESSASAAHTMSDHEGTPSPTQTHYSFDFSSDDENQGDDHHSNHSDNIDPLLEDASSNPHFHHSLGRTCQGRLLRVTHRQALRYHDLFD